MFDLPNSAKSDLTLLLKVNKVVEGQRYTVDRAYVSI